MIAQDKIKHGLIGFVAVCIGSFLFGWEIGLLGGVGVSIAIEGFQWLINKLLERYPSLEGELFFLEVRFPDVMDAVAGCAGTVVGTIIAMLMLAQ